MFETNNTSLSLYSIRDGSGKDNKNLNVNSKCYILWPLRAYFCLGYHVFAIPFNVAYDKLRNKYVVQVSPKRKIMCLLLVWIPTFILNIYDTVRHGQPLLCDTRTALSYFNLLSLIAYTSRNLLFAKMLFTQESQVCQIFTTLQNTILPFNASYAKKSIVCLFYLGTACCLLFSTQYFGLISQYYVGVKSTNTSALLKFANIGRKRFLFETSSIEASSFSIVDIILVTMHLLLPVIETFTFCCCETFFYGVVSITLWLATGTFDAYISSLGKVDIEESEDSQKTQTMIHDMITELRGLSSMANKAWSVLIFHTTVYNSLRLMLAVEPAVARKDINYLLDISISWVCMTLSLGMAAEVQRKVCTFKDWLLDKETQDKYFPDKSNMNLMMQQLDSSIIGVGRHGVYVLNYGFLAQLIVVIITLFLISFEKLSTSVDLPKECRLDSTIQGEF